MSLVPEVAGHQSIELLEQAADDPRGRRTMPAVSDREEKSQYISVGTRHLSGFSEGLFKLHGFVEIRLHTR